METKVNNTTLKLVKGDITTQAVDVIVNAANTSLLGGGGVDGAIHKAGGKAILEECMRIRAVQGGCKVGEAVITTAGNLKAKYVIHTVGPVWNGGEKDEAALLKNCYRNVLRLASEYKVSSIAFPNISTGVYHFPKERAGIIATQTTKEYLLNEVEHTLQEIIFICFDDENYSIYQSLLKDI